MADISEIFDKNPLELTEANLTAIVTELRQSRHKFQTAAVSAKKPTARKKAAVSAKGLRVAEKLKGLDL